MMNNYSFRVNERSKTFCDNIVEEMIRLFGIALSEAIGRINRQWNGNDFLKEDDLRYHETAEYWANDMYYGWDSFWWTNPSDLEPKPYP